MKSKSLFVGSVCCRMIKVCSVVSPGQEYPETARPKPEVKGKAVGISLEWDSCDITDKSICRIVLGSTEG